MGGREEDGDWHARDGSRFALEDVAVPVGLRHGANDTNVPVAHGRWIASHLRQAEVHYTDDNHITMFLRSAAEDFPWLTRCAAISVGVKAGTRAAASSIASWIPSSRRHSSATAVASSSMKR
jgi:pimeloyl-ACP methyl ester carboxylesterase